MEEGASDIRRQIEADLAEINERAVRHAGDPKNWIYCNVVVIEDTHFDPVGIWAAFQTVPRVGEIIRDIGHVEEVHHFPTVDGQGGMPAIMLYVRRRRRDR